MARDVALRELDQAGFRISNLGNPTAAGDATKTDNATAPKANVAQGPTIVHSRPPTALAAKLARPIEVSKKPIAEARSASGAVRLMSALVVPSVAAM